MRQVEWRPGSGRVAAYEEHEYELVKAIYLRGKRGEILPSEAAQQIDVIHELLLLGGHFVDDTEPVQPVQLSLDEITGKYAGKDATATEWESGAAIEQEDAGPLRPGRVGHRVLLVYGHGERLTAYEASLRECGDPHGSRRESRRLFDRGFLAKDGTLPNPAPKGRERVDAFRINAAGWEELRRLAAAP